MDNNFAEIYERELKSAQDMKINTNSAYELGEAVRLAELKALFSAFLPAANDKDINQIADIQRELRVQRKRLNDLLSANIIDEVEFQMASSREAEWSFRRCAIVLGKERFEMLFGVNPESAMNTSEELIVPTLVKRYKSSEVERKRVCDTWMRINPIAMDEVVNLWSHNSSMHKAVRAIVRAESLFKNGEIETCVNNTRSILNIVQQQHRIGDTWLYLASWALHIQGRAYESLSHWSSATEKYEESLELKLHMKDWLPQGAFVATELKLGSVEVKHSPLQGISRLTRILSTLRNNPKVFCDNTKMRDYFCVAGELKLANAYLEIKQQEEAAIFARKALKRVKNIADSVGEAQALFALFRASELHKDDFINRLNQLIADKKISMANPKISSMFSFMKEVNASDLAP